MVFLGVLLALIGFSFAVPHYLKDCVEIARPICNFINKVEDYTGKVYKIYLKKSKRTKKCFYTVKGKRGTAVVDAVTGEVVKFYKKR